MSSVGSHTRKRPVQHAVCFAHQQESKVQVDSHTGPDENSDTPFHFGVPCGQAVKTNSHQDGSSNCEVESSKMPCEDDQPSVLHGLCCQMRTGKCAGTTPPTASTGSPRGTLLSPGPARGARHPPPVITPAPFITEHPLLLPPSSGILPDLTGLRSVYVPFCSRRRIGSDFTHRYHFYPCRYYLNFGVTQ